MKAETRLGSVFYTKEKGVTTIADYVATATADMATTGMFSNLVDEDGNITAASIVAAVNDEDGSVVYIDANHIRISGSTTFLTADDIGANGSTTINGNLITTGTIKSEYLYLYGNLSVYENETDVTYGKLPGGYIGYGTGSTGTDTTSGIHMYYPYYRNTDVAVSEVICTNAGARMSYASYDLYINEKGCFINAPLRLVANDGYGTSLPYSGSSGQVFFMI